VKQKRAKYITALEVNELMADADRVIYPSKFRFLKEHKGYRPGNLHLLLGTSGGGKSTVARSLLIDILPRIQKKVLIWLSEETHLEFVTELARTGIFNHGKELKNKIDFFSEQENDLSEMELCTTMKEFVDSDEYDFFIYDNITTSKVYMGQLPAKQSQFAVWFKKICSQNKVAALIVAHTGAEISDNMNRFINYNDIRGVKTLPHISQFIYILQRFINEAGYIYQMLLLVKNRGQRTSEKMFLIEYDDSMMLYSGDRIVNYEKMTEIFKNRQKLK